MGVALQQQIFREYDIRGVVGVDFDSAFAKTLGQAFATYISRAQKVTNPIITVGHDARLSCPELVGALTEGLLAAGAKVLGLGLVTTPMSYFSTFQLSNVAGNIMVTGSHNPPEYNGFKVSRGKNTMYGDEIQALYKLMAAGDLLSQVGGTYEKVDIFPAYIERYKTEFKNLKPIPVVVDCGNGAAGIVVRRMYEAVGLKPEFLFEEPDGRFPNHHPDPTVEHNLEDLKRAVKKSSARIGIGFDGDADRIGIVDHNGRFVPGDEMMVLISRAVLKSSPGAKIIGDVKCSDRLYTDIAKHGGTPIMYKTGHSLIKNKIKEEHAPFGGELSGHVCFADRNYGYDDAPYAGLRLIEVLSQTGLNIDQLLSDFPHAYNTPEIRIDTTEEKKWAIVATLKAKYPSDTADYKVNLIDGLRVSFKDGWALARASNTQPVLVLRFEADSAAALERIQKQFEAVVNPLL